jgi:hypothetical protein
MIKVTDLVPITSPTRTSRSSTALLGNLRGDVREPGYLGQPLPEPTVNHLAVRYLIWRDAQNERSRQGIGALGEVTCLSLDRCTLHRDNLVAVFARHGRSRPAAAWDLPSLSAVLREVTPEIVLINMYMRDSVAFLKLVRVECPEVNVIVVGISEDDEAEIIACAEAGVAGYPLRTEVPETASLQVHRR